MSGKSVDGEFPKSPVKAIFFCEIVMLQIADPKIWFRNMAAKIEENNREVRKLSEAVLEDSSFWKRLYGALIQAGQTRAFGG